MKVLLVVSLLIGSASAFAIPSVGDKATFSIQTVSPGQVIQGTMTFELTKQIGNQFELRTTMTVGNSVETKISTEEGFATDDQLQHAVNDCEELGGVKGHFDLGNQSLATCKVSENDGYVELAQVPFGIVRAQELKDSKVVTIQLQSYVLGK